MSRSGLQAHLDGACFWPCTYCDREDARAEKAEATVDGEDPEEDDNAHD
jgi:hypothetical protein